MNIELSAPSKTFLIGEYAVLSGGPALVLNTAPRFSLIARQAFDGSEGIPEGSPASLWISQRAPLLREWHLEFKDPYAGKGGMGASSAQFLLVHALTTFLQSSVSRAVQGQDLKALWNDYQVLTGGRASGADVLSQSVGHVALVDVKNVEATGRAWPFADLGFFVFRLKQKVQTHLHLADLAREPLKALVAPAHACVESFISGASDRLIRDSRIFVESLESLHLQAPETMKVTSELRAKSWCRLAKGCGAMGADTAVVLFNTEDRQAAVADLTGFEILGSDLELASGLEMHWSWT